MMPQQVTSSPFYAAQPIPNGGGGAPGGFGLGAGSGSGSGSQDPSHVAPGYAGGGGGFGGGLGGGLGANHNINANAPPMGTSFPRHGSFHGSSPMAGPSRWAGSGDPAGVMSGLSILKSRRDSQNSPHAPPSSPSNNPHAGFHPSSFGPSFALSALALGASSSTGSSGFAMSISPPAGQWGNPGGWGGQSGSYVGSLGALGTSFGRERDREIEAKYVRDFTCCGKQLNGMHELLEHYEEEHAGVVPDVRMMNAAANPNAAPGGPGPRPSFSMPNANANGSAYNPQIAGMQQSHGHGDAPTPPGMMDIEMDEPSAPSHAFMSSPLGRPGLPGGVPPQSSPGLWATAFRPQFPNVGAPPPQCVPPSLLSFSSATPQQGLGTSSAPPSAPSTPAPRPPTQEELEAKALRKAQRKAERMAAREEASASDAEHEKKFPCPIEGCGKVYKQANGLKYHLTRSINSGHGNVAAMGGITALLGEKAGTHVDIKG